MGRGAGLYSARSRCEKLMGWLQRIQQLFLRVKPKPVDPSSTLARGMARTQGMETSLLGAAAERPEARHPAGDVPSYLSIQEELGRGAMAVVHAALDTRTGERIAVKRLLLSSEVAADELAEVRARFLREAQAAQALSHPDILRVHEFGTTPQGDAWMTMERVQGHDLSRHVIDGHLLPVGRVLSIAIRVARALHYAHSQGVVHRDIKPANLMVDPDRDIVRIMDFGIARMEGGSRTRTGLVLGTPSYMAPEQLAGQTVNGRSDLYALGAVIHQLLTGRLPHRSESMARLMYEIANERVADVRSLRPGLPEALAMVLSLALEKRPDLRYANGEDMAQDLEAVLTQLQDDGESLDAGTISPNTDIDPFAATQRFEPRKP
jgi:eukaryotic-like serine/threonine-protein kinase